MASFIKYLPLLQQVEGGFQKDPDDPGNYNSNGELVGTHFGISARFYESVIGRPPSESDMRAIAKAKAKNLFREKFWDAQNANSIDNQKMANTIIDHQINAGNGVQLAQKTLKNYFGYSLSVDNQIGMETLAALNSVDPKEFVEVFNRQRATYYKNIGNSTFIAGWLRRLKKFAWDTPFISVGLIATLGLVSYFGFQLLKNN